MAEQCSITVERLPNGRYRAASPLFADCEAVAATAEEARRSVELAIERLLQDRARTTAAPPLRPGAST
jgi:hypothetical protein